MKLTKQPFLMLTTFELKGMHVKLGGTLLQTRNIQTEYTQRNTLRFPQATIYIFIRNTFLVSLRECCRERLVMIKSMAFVFAQHHAEKMLFFHHVLSVYILLEFFANSQCKKDINISLSRPTIRCVEASVSSNYYRHN